MITKGLWLGLAAFIAAIAICMTTITFSTSYQYCKAPHANSATDSKQPYVDALIPKTGGTFIDCESFFANENGAAITALATVFLGLITGGLIWLGRLQLLTTRAQLRAFVFVPQVGHYFNLAPADEQPSDAAKPKKVVSWEFRPVWQNSGETQTKDMTTHVDHEFRDSLLPADFGFQDNISFAARNLIGPKSTGIGGTTRAFTSGELAEVKSGKRFLYLWGWVKYNDIFPGTSQHITRYCVQVVVGGDPTQSDCHFFYMIPNDGNCSDAECVAMGFE